MEFIRKLEEEEEDGGRSGEVGELWPFSELSAFAESSAGPCGMSRADAGPV